MPRHLNPNYGSGHRRRAPSTVATSCDLCGERIRFQRSDGPPESCPSCGFEMREYRTRPCPSCGRTLQWDESRWGERQACFPCFTGSAEVSP